MKQIRFGSTVWWRDEAARSVQCGMVVAIEKETGYVSIQPARHDLVVVLPNGALYETPQEAEKSRPTPVPVWDDARAAEELSAWMKKIGTSCNMHARLNSVTGWFIVRINPNTDLNATFVGEGKTWAAAVQSAIELWEKVL